MHKSKWVFWLDELKEGHKNMWSGRTCATKAGKPLTLDTLNAVIAQLKGDNKMANRWNMTLAGLLTEEVNCLANAVLECTGSKKDWYNYVAAVRGMDSNNFSETLKCMFTCFLRGGSSTFAGGTTKDFVQLLKDNTPEQIANDLALELKSSKGMGCDHWFIHAKTALDAFLNTFKRDCEVARITLRLRELANNLTVYHNLEAATHNIQEIRDIVIPPVVLPGGIDPNNLCALKELGIKQEESMPNTGFTVDDCSAIQVRVGGAFTNNGLWLNPAYFWRVIHDDEGQDVLVFLKKEIRDEPDSA